MKHSLLLLLIVGLTACSNRAFYDAMKHDQCLEKTGQYNCNEIENYQEYNKKREDLLNEKDAEGYQKKRDKLLKTNEQTKKSPS